MVGKRRSWTDLVMLLKFGVMSGAGPPQEIGLTTSARFAGLEFHEMREVLMVPHVDDLHVGWQLPTTGGAKRVPEHCGRCSRVCVKRRTQHKYLWCDCSCEAHAPPERSVTMTASAAVLCDFARVVVLNQTLFGARVLHRCVVPTDGSTAVPQTPRCIAPDGLKAALSGLWRVRSFGCESRVFIFPRESAK